MSFDTIIMVDWSAANDRGPRPVKDAIWACIARDGAAEDPVYLRNRQLAEDWLVTALEAEHAAGRRALVGFDICFAFPRGFATRLIGSEDTLALWDWFAARITDSPTHNNRFELAGEINARFPGTGPFWFNATPRDIPHLPRKGTDRTGHGLPEGRAVERAAPRAFSPWQLGGAGAVGGQVFMALPVLSRLRARFGADLSVWPFQNTETPLVLAEAYFSLIDAPLDTDPIKDAAQVRLYASRFSALPAARWAELLDHPADPEGWVLGLGKEHLLESALQPPPLRNDCFAMPQGAYWTPVDAALGHLRAVLRPVTGTEEAATAGALGRILAAPATAARSHPPQPNSAVDGYAFAGPAPEGITRLPLVQGRAAAGQAYPGTVPPGHAIRILTGAHLPAGVDTVVLQEDVTTDGIQIAFHGPLKRGANARRAGEDMKAGAQALPTGRRLTPADLATLSACGVARVTLRKPLRVGVLSTGDELAQPGGPVRDDQIFDANRPMLLATLTRWGFAPVDLGRAPDDRPTLRRMLDDAARRCDVILTSGGASAGDEDHMSALLQETGTQVLWRIAIKPGRPLALGMWDGTPVFGLPGNPVAAQVCTLIFARPALEVLAGGDWPEPQGFDVPAAFSKRKKEGRREYLRARITQGRAEVFPSEGSGRVSGLSWATGLVELPDGAAEIAPGTPVRFIPYGSFGL